MVFAVDPDSAKFVLKAPEIRKCLLKFSDYAEEYFGENIVGKDGEDWRRHRSILSPGFHSTALMSYYPIFKETTDNALQKLPVNSDFEISDFCSRFTLDILGKSIFNHDFGRIEGRNDKYYIAYKNITGGLSTTKGLLLGVLPFVGSLPFQFVKEHKESVDLIISLFSDIIEQSKDKNDNSILSNMIQHTALDSTGKLSKNELIANIWVLFLAGHDTTSSALIWACNCLRNYQEIQEKVYQEIRSVIGQNIPTEEDLEKLVYLDCFIQEVLRLHSPAPALVTRAAEKDVQYKDMIIPKGARVGLFFQEIHTNPEFWDDPLKFDPDRFRPENRKGRNHFLHMPFSAGPRQCIGTQFSLIEQKLFITRLLQKYRIVDPVSVKPWPMDKFLGFGVENNVPIRFVKREP
jgi:cytochrome P450